MTITPELNVLVQAVKRYAMQHYNEEGWDICVEAYTDKEIAEELVEDRCETELQAVESIRWCINLQDERRREVRSTAW